MTNQINTPAPLPTHLKTTSQHMQDRSRLRQVALLWWSQKIYECAVNVSRISGPPQPYEENRQRYREAMKILAGAVKELKAIQQGMDQLEQLGPHFAGAGMGKRLGSGTAQQHPIGGHQPKGGNCSSDDECPEDYICDNSETCVYLFPELP